MVKRNAARVQGRIRIIAGEWRGRRVDIPEGTAVRPTPDRVRETVFNWLRDTIVGARCLDLFAGTGVLGFEALSRGAAEAWFVEQDAALVAALRSPRKRSAQRRRSFAAMRSRSCASRRAHASTSCSSIRRTRSRSSRCSRCCRRGFAPERSSMSSVRAAPACRPCRTRSGRSRATRAQSSTGSCGSRGYNAAETLERSGTHVKIGAMYPGTFDPITRGHEDLVRRCVRLFDRVVLAIASNPKKAPLFSLEERVALAQEVLRDLPEVSITGYTGLTVDFARANGFKAIIRGCAPSRISSTSSSSR